MVHENKWSIYPSIYGGDLNGIRNGRHIVPLAHHHNVRKRHYHLRRILEFVKLRKDHERSSQLENYLLRLSFIPLHGLGNGEGESIYICWTHTFFQNTNSFLLRLLPQFSFLLQILTGYW